MKIIGSVLSLLILVLYGFSVQSNDENMWSFSLGQFDVNDTVDSSEIRFEYLYANNFLKNNYDLKPFLGVMRNGDNGKYIYSGLRKNIGISENSTGRNEQLLKFKACSLSCSDLSCLHDVMCLGSIIAFTTYNRLGNNGIKHFWIPIKFTLNIVKKSP